MDLYHSVILMIRSISIVAYLGGLAFLPLDVVCHDLADVKDNAPDTVAPLINYFDSTYVIGSFRRSQRPTGPDDIVPALTIRCNPPLIPQSCGTAIKHSAPFIIQNLCESWNRAFQSLNGIAHPTL
ncbi:hypothetical protein LSH36_329g03081 [Paralvinella palmiformis]|uniref:Uncharacterized protein n=1 Tax=Paralvinella palmiformis TaxID=53620 RepID=A0AAD9JGB7_9ANNE|nr:hypothetical protein LSH36_329g03081 [Paralvinella palmiformis]